MTDITLVSPCGADCTECEKYPNECKGCREIMGRVWWAEYAGLSTCPYYDCCINHKKLPHCGKCFDFPCDIFYKGDPTKSDEENRAILDKQIKTLTELQHKPL